VAAPPSDDRRSQPTTGPVAGQQQISPTVIQALEDALALVDSDSPEHASDSAGRPPRR